MTHNDTLDAIASMEKELDGVIGADRYTDNDGDEWVRKNDGTYWLVPGRFAAGSRVKNLAMLTVLYGPLS